MASAEQLNQFLKEHFPQARSTIESVGNMSARIRQEIGFSELRPGGTVSGPVMFGVADLALYAAILGEIGLVPLAVTTNLSMNFLRKPSGERDLIGECKLIKLGKSLAVGEVSLFSDGDEQPVAHAVGTYSIPPDRTPLPL